MSTSPWGHPSPDDRAPTGDDPPSSDGGPATEQGGPLSGGFPAPSPWPPAGPPPSPYPPTRGGHPFGPPDPWGSGPWGAPGPSAWAPAPGPPSRPPRDPQRVRRNRRIAVGVLTLLLVATLVVLGLLAFVTGPRFARVDVFDRAAVERGVAGVISEDWRRQVSAVRCPDDIEVVAGESFRCDAVVDGRAATVPVDILDDQGTYQVGQPR